MTTTLSNAAIKSQLNKPVILHIKWNSLISKKNAMKYSVKLIFVPIEDNMCQVSWFELHRIKDDFFKEIPNKMSDNDAIEELKSLDSCDDIEERHRRADEILLSVISNYCPNGPEIVDSFISLNKNY